MYRPAQFREDNPDILAAAIREIRLATLVSVTGEELTASHIPMLLKCSSSGATLEGHVARANPQWKNVNQSFSALAIFLGPHAYISPTWYASKAETQRVVPTWNYISVQASGPLSIIEDRDWLLQHVTEFTDNNEATQHVPWQVSDAPVDFISEHCGGIVGIRMSVERLEGAWKMAQHKSEADRHGVIIGLTNTGQDGADGVVRVMSELEEQRRDSPRS